jgi:GT2 family glycosyltransferase/ubiquinone/menaquinone biosynthesis C-methylase UbiE
MKLKKLKNEILYLISNTSFDSALQLIREGLSINIFDSDLYVYMGLTYKCKKSYDCAYLCFENALQYSKDEKNKNSIISEINKLKESQKISVKDYSIIILTLNNLKYTKECIESIRKYNTLNNYELIVIDNNSTDDTPMWLKAQKDIKYILNNENKGFPAGCNQGIHHSQETNDIFLLNNDAVIMPNSIFNLRMGLYSEEKIGAASAVSNFAPSQTIQDKFKNISQYLDYSLKNNITNGSQYGYRLKLIGFALFFKRIVLNKVGLLDELFTPGNYEDDDISLRIIKSGYKNILCRDSFIYHYGNKSFGRDIKKFHNILTSNQQKFQSKWKFNPLKSLLIRNDVLELIDAPFDGQLNILEVGCSCGATLLEIKNIYPNANTYGFELNSYTAEIAKFVANVTVGDIETSSLDYKENFFDYIILADVLQYLKNPLKTLENIKKYLKHDGYILSSITNVLNFKILKNLIDGNWSYDNEWFWDNNQLKFFTYKDILKMFKTVNYNNIFITSAANMPETYEDKEFINKIKELSLYENISDELVNYEYYIKAQNTDFTNTEIEKKHDLKNEINIIIKELDKNLNSNELLTELINLIKCKNITCTNIIQSIENKVKFQGKILNHIAVKCLNENLEEYALQLLEKAYTLEPRDLDITYNLSYCLTAKEQYHSALDYLNSLYNTNSNIENLRKHITNHIC